MVVGDTSKDNMKHVFNLYHRDDDEHSPFGIEHIPRMNGDKTL